MMKNNSKFNSLRRIVRVNVEKADTCRNCGGSGWVVFGEIPCFGCGGSGTR